MMKNSIYFIVIALLVVELLKILIYANYRTWDVTRLTQINPILIWACPRKRGWRILLHFGNNLSNSHSPSRLIHGILFLQSNTLALLLHKFASSTSSLVVLASSFPSLQTPTLNTYPQHLTPFAFLPSEPLFPSIPTSTKLCKSQNMKYLCKH